MASGQSFGRFTLTGPPRLVPLLLRVRLLFGGLLNQFGWFVFGVGVFIAWALSGQSDPKSLLDFRGPLQEAKGVVRQCEATRTKENDRRIYAHHYQFQFNGAIYTGVSYAAGRRSSPGAEVTVEFPVGKPERSRIVGMRTAPLPSLVCLFAVFPAAGLCLVAAGFWKGLGAVRLLKHGQQAFGVLRQKAPTNTRVNNRLVYKLTFEYTDELGQTHMATARTTEPERLEDEEQEPLLYDPLRPGRAVLLDQLPGSPRIDETGQIRASSPAGLLLALVAPLVVVGGLGLCLLWFFLQNG